MIQTLHRRWLGGLTAAVVALAPALGTAQNQVLDFTSMLGMANYTPVPQSYGDMASLAVSNATRTGFGNSALRDCGQGASHVDFWNNNYSSLVGNAFACIDGYVGEFFFQPTAGNQVTLNGMDFGSYAASGPLFVGPTRPFTLQIFDGNWNLLSNQSLIAASTIHVAPGLTSSTGLYLQWGTDWDVGIDNIDVTVSAVPTSAVPEPSTYALFASGLVALGIASRRRRA
jgi:hypothetical protein